MSAPGALGTVLLTGASGQLGYELRRELATLGTVHAPSRAAMNLGRADEILRLVGELRPAVIVNAAAYTAVDDAERDADECARVNAHAPRALAQGARECGAVLVHYSTDYVFDGTKAGPYTEDDVPAPLGAYGRTKLEGEQAIRDAQVEHLIFRTSWVYGTRGRNFLGTVRRLAGERPVLRIVDDQVGAPTWSRMIAAATAQVLASCARTGLRETVRSAGGTYHMTAAGSTSWYGFARAIAAHPAGFPAGAQPAIEAIPSSGYPTAARRPANSVLDNTKLRERLGVSLPSWEEQLQLALDA